MFINEGLRFFKGGKPKPKPFTTAEIAASSNPKAFEALVNFVRETNKRPKEDWEREQNLLIVLLKKFNDKNLLPPYGDNILPSLEDLNDINKRLLVIFMAAQTITLMLENPAYAADPKNKSSISWAEEAIAKIDPMEYLLYKKSERSKASPIYLFDEDDKRILILNVYHEIRGGLSEGVEGEKSILGVLYSVFERMKSSSYGADPKSVVLAQAQYSWTLEILSGALEKKKIDRVAYTRLKEILDEFTDLPFGIAHDKLKKRLEELVNLNSDRKVLLPYNMNDYHLYGMLSPEKDKDGKYSKHASNDTKARILKAEELHKAGSPLVIKLGRHLHYNSETIDKLVKPSKSN